jgi:hypothetical protein
VRQLWAAYAIVVSLMLMPVVLALTRPRRFWSAFTGRVRAMGDAGLLLGLAVLVVLPSLAILTALEGRRSSRTGVSCGGASSSSPVHWSA